LGLHQIRESWEKFRDGIENNQVRQRYRGGLSNRNPLEQKKVALGHAKRHLD